MSNLIQCLRCKHMMIREEWDGHVCSRHFKGVRNIEVLQWWETINEHGERVAFGIGSDGYTYKLNEVKEGFVEIDPANVEDNRIEQTFPSNEKLQGEDSNEDVTEP